ncbi:MAG: hypothetical protein JNM39_07695 [Bdellovibrionaceae bacterium]|nr:hypothetical protein [Pseudobdellovibrionaceae bacterium]
MAELSYDFQRDTFNFSYHPEWQKKEFPLSPHLPLLGEILPENTKIFLENLLAFLQKIRPNISMRA